MPHCRFTRLLGVPFVAALLIALPPAVSSAADEPQPAVAVPAATATPAPPPAPVAAPPSFESVVAPPAASPPPSQPAQPPTIAPPAPVILPVARPRDCSNPEPSRDGFYLRFVQGTGYAKFHGTGPRGTLSGSGLGSHSTVAIGGGLARGLALAGTIQSTMIEANLDGGPFTNATITTDGGGSAVASGKAKMTQGQIGAMVDWYPYPLDGFHAGLSAGVGMMSLSHNADGSTLGGTATSGSLFVGYDFAISRTWEIGLGLVASGVTSASLKTSSGDDTAYKLNGYSIELGASLLYF
jgi:hypothetical protein